MRGGANEIYTRAGSCVDKLTTYRAWIACVFGMHGDIWCLCSQLLAKSMSSATIRIIYLQCFQFSPLPLKFSILLLQCSLFCLSISASFSCSVSNSLFCLSISASFSCSVLFCLSISASFSCSWAYVSVLCEPVVHGGQVYNCTHNDDFPVFSQGT